jgi:hypothetical protein
LFCRGKQVVLQEGNDGKKGEKHIKRWRNALKMKEKTQKSRKKFGYSGKK